MATDQLILRDQQRFEYSSVFAHTPMDFLTEFKEHPFAHFNKDGLFSELLKKLYKTHLKVHLTVREADLLLHIASGYSRNRILDEMFIGKDRYHGLRHSITKKLEKAGFDFEKFDAGTMMALLTLRLMGQLI